MTLLQDTQVNIHEQTHQRQRQHQFQPSEILSAQGTFELSDFARVVRIRIVLQITIQSGWSRTLPADTT